MDTDGESSVEKVLFESEFSGDAATFRLEIEKK